MIDNLYKNLHDKLDKEEFEFGVKAMEEMAETNADIKKSMAAIKLCISTVEDKEVVCIANVILTLLLVMPVNILKSFNKTLPQLISRKLLEELGNINNNCKNQDESNE